MLTEDININKTLKIILKSGIPWMLKYLKISCSTTSLFEIQKLTETFQSDIMDVKNG